MSDVAQSQVSRGFDGESRRDFATLATSGVGAGGLPRAVSLLAGSLNPAPPNLAVTTDKFTSDTAITIG